MALLPGKGLLYKFQIHENITGKNKNKIRFNFMQIDVKYKIRKLKKGYQRQFKI